MGIDGICEKPKRKPKSEITGNTGAWEKYKNVQGGCSSLYIAMQEE